MKEFNSFYERDEVEIINGIPSGIIRNGLSFLLLTVCILILLSCLIQVNNFIPFEAKIQLDKGINITVSSFANSQATNSIPINRKTSLVKGMKADNNLGIVTLPSTVAITKRNFKTMRDSTFTFDSNPAVQLFINVTDQSNTKRFIQGQPMKIAIDQSNAEFSTTIKNVFQTSDHRVIYELDTETIPERIKYNLICNNQSAFKGHIENYKTTMLKQIWNNLFNKLKI